MEGEMPDCPKCSARLKIEGDKWVCPNIVCTYQRDFPRKVPPQADLLRELEEIKKHSIHISPNTQESDVMTMVYNLRRKPRGLGVRPGTLYFAPDP